MMSGWEELLTVIVCAIGNCSFQVVKLMPRVGAWPGRLSWTSYAVPGVSDTRLPRHSVLRESYHMSKPCFHALSPALRYCTWQPAVPPGEVQYRPTDSKVGIAFTPVDGSALVGGGVGV